MGKGSPGRGGGASGHGLDGEVERALRSPPGLDARELIDLIHRVNPPPRSRPSELTTRRYEQKSALQSLLIHRFKEDLTVDLDGGENVVGLRHRRLPIDACHAPIDSLDEEARSWVRLQLDLKEGYRRDLLPRATSAPVEQGPDTSALGLGRAALEAYDYPLAREHFERAFAEREGAASVAVPLLELLVDMLAADEDALALEPRLAPGVIQGALVRGLLALAAARAGRADQAQALALGGEGHAAQALVVVADQALALGDEPRVAVLLGQVVELDAAHPELGRLRDAAARLRAQDREPLERDLARAVEQGETATATALAQRLLARWPESAAARRALKELEARERAARVTELVERAATAQAQGDLELALALLHEAQRADPTQAGLQAQVEAVEARARAARESSALAAVERQLAASPEEGLEAYLELGPALRRQVTEPTTRLHRARLDALPLEKGRARALVRAVLALAEAESQVADPTRALATLEPHRALLAKQPEMLALVARLEGQRSERQRAEVEATLKQAAEAVEAGQSAVARQLLALVPREEPQAVALLARLDALATRERLLGSVARHEGEQHFLEARDAARALAAESAGEERIRWEERQHALDQQVRAQYRQQVDALGAAEPGAELARRPHPRRGVGEVETLLTSKGTLLHVEAQGRWLFVEEIDLASQRVVRQMSLEAPFDFGFEQSTFDGACLWVMGERGNLLAVDVDRWEIRQARSLREILPQDCIIEDLLVPGGGRWLWTRWEVRAARSETFAEVIDLATWRSVRSNEVFRVDLVPLPGESVVALLAFGKGGSLHAPGGGGSKRLGTLPTELRLEAVRAHPDGKRAVALVVDPDEEKESDLQHTVGLHWSGLDQPLWIEDSGDESAHGLATSSEDGVILAAVELDDQHEVIAWDGEGHELYRLTVPKECTLVQDAEGRRVAAQWPTATGWRAVRLSRAQPDVGAPSPRWERTFLPVRPGFGCGELDFNSPHSADEIPGIIAEASRQAIAAGSDTVNLDSLDMVRTLTGAVAEAQRDVPAMAKEQLQKVLSDWPGAGIAHLYAANQALVRDDWDEVARLVETMRMDLLRPAEIAHAHHLRGVVRFRDGDFAGAHAAWVEGLKHDAEDACRLEEAARLAESLSTRPEAHRLGRGLAAADSSLARGDARGALLALDHPWAQDLNELQTQARLAEAWVAVVPADASERFRQRLTLARYLAHHHELGNERDSTTNLKLANAWDEARLADLARRIEAHLAP